MSDPNPNPNVGRSRRRRIRNPEIRFPFAGARPRKGGAAAAPAAAATPQLRWKFSESDADPDPSRVSDPGGERKRGEVVSARKLAAGIWQSEMLEIEPNLGHQQLSNPRNDILHKRRTSVVYPDPSMERATKWDTDCLKQSNEVSQSFDHLKLLVDHQMTQASSIESKLKAELDWARDRISKLETKRHSAKKKIERILKKHAGEKASWRVREHEKIRAIVDGMKDDLSMERKNRRRTEILNSKLLEELTEAKKTAKRFLHDYEKEKKARELLEDVCDQLAKEAGEDRAEVEESKRESMRAREELEEERKMLQMAEVWREERVQMKLIDAKLALENQCLRIKELQTELESFLRSRSDSSLDVAEIIEAKMLIEAAAESVKIREMNEFVYHPPPASEDIFSIFEELQQREEPKESKDEGCSCNSPQSDASKIETGSPATDLFLEKPTNGSVEDDSEWETLSRGDLGSGSGESNCDIDEDLRKSVSSISKLWPTCLDTSKNCLETPVEGPKERASNGVLNDLGCLSPPEHWSSPESVNPHATRGMKGCIEWPRGIHKQSLKTKLLEARLESHKVQIRHVLKQKI